MAVVNDKNWRGTNVYANNKIEQIKQNMNVNVRYYYMAAQILGRLKPPPSPLLWPWAEGLFAIYHLLHTCTHVA